MKAYPVYIRKSPTRRRAEWLVNLLLWRVWVMAALLGIVYLGVLTAAYAQGVEERLVFIESGIGTFGTIKSVEIVLPESAIQETILTPKRKPKVTK